MLKRTIEYTDYDGNPRKEDFYFNLTKAEVIEMQMSEAGGLEKTIAKIVAAQDTTRLIALFKELVLRAYGEKSLDGRRFIKKRPDGSRPCDEFAETEAYSELFMELATNAKSASDFVNGIMPKIDAQPTAVPPLTKKENN